MIQADFAKNFFNLKEIRSKFANKIEYSKWSGETGSEFIENLRKRVNHLFREFTMNSLSTSRVTMNFPWIYYRFRGITLTSLSASRFYYEFSICFANSVRIHYWFREITINSLSASRVLFKFPFVFGNSLSFSRIQLGSFSLELTIDSLSISWFHFEFTIWFPKLLLIH